MSDVVTMFDVGFFNVLLRFDFLYDNINKTGKGEAVWIDFFMHGGFFREESKGR